LTSAGAFFIIGCFIWAIRSFKPNQIEADEA
jgi:Na+-transporting NADH:ubiquinone oxidoreductase subunit NqrD